MFIKNLFQHRKTAGSIMVIFFIAVLFINSDFEDGISLNRHGNPGMGRGIVTKIRNSKINLPGASSGLLVQRATGSANQESSNKSGRILASNNQSKKFGQYRSFSENDLGMLARIIHAEAGGESLPGQVAVGAVLLNRIKSGRFPATLKANIFRAGEFESVSNGYIWSNPHAISYKAARLALKGWDPSFGALYFFNPAKTRSRWIWNRPIYVTIGRHYFAG